MAKVPGHKPRGRGGKGGTGGRGREDRALEVRGRGDTPHIADGEGETSCGTMALRCPATGANVSAETVLTEGEASVNYVNESRPSGVGVIGVSETTKESRQGKRDRCWRMFRDKPVLAPLTTVGNMPFRRVCISYGCDVTMSEMALAGAVIEGKRSEVTLIKRHESEKFFGVQLAGGFPDVMSRCAELLDLADTCVDFVDVNAGCPLDGMHKRGAGSALMTRRRNFENLLKGMNEILTCPITAKLRTAHDKDPNHSARSLIPRLAEWGASAITLHGRTQKQRYTKSADWDEIAQCAAELLKKSQGAGDDDWWDIPFIG
eukprot:GHVN01020374.1.p1 GENE.GHVN01020374.1~~GHVN01020374.1.p1  ORF type:complete len:318 (-),score=68.28 GHVN01020374.1:3518-4471(-)